MHSSNSHALCCLSAQTSQNRLNRILFFQKFTVGDAGLTHRIVRHHSSVRAPTSRRVCCSPSASWDRPARPGTLVETCTVRNAQRVQVLGENLLESPWAATDVEASLEGFGQVRNAAHSLRDQEACCRGSRQETARCAFSNARYAG